MSPWPRRIVVTGALVIAYRIGTGIPLPGIGAIWDWVHSTDARNAGSLGYGLERFSFLGLGIYPYISASGILLLLSGAIAPLRRLRDGDEEQRSRFAIYLLGLTALLAMIQGLGIAIYCDSLRRQVDPAISTTGSGYRVAVMLALVAGSFVTVGLAHFITKYGIANGVAILVAIPLLTEAIPRFRASILDPRDSQAPPPLLAVLVLGVGILLSVLIIHSCRKLPLQPERDTGVENHNSGEMRWLPLRIQPAGAVPLLFAERMLVLPLTLRGFFRPDATGPILSDWSYTAVSSLLIFASSMLIASWLFNGCDLEGRLHAWRVRIKDGAGDVWTARRLEQTQEKLAWMGALMLVLFGALPLLGLRYDRFLEGVAGLVDARLVVLVAVVLEIWRNLRAWRMHPLGRSWARVYRSDIALEARLVRHALHQAGLTAVMHSSRPSPVGGSFGYWEVCRPQFPSLIVYSGLGSGCVEVYVPTSARKQAEELLAGIVPPLQV
jgi:preprotein translocase subunit SecY